MGRANWQAAYDRFPWLAGPVEGFLERMEANPDIVMGILRDMYDMIKTEEEKKQGIVRMGRRPKRIPESEREFWATVLPPAFSDKPFPQALAWMMDELGLTQRALASKVPTTQATVSRLASGQMVPDMAMMEAIARALRVGPWFFVEWRARYFASMVELILTDNPNLGVAMVKRWRGDVLAGAA